MADKEIIMKKGNASNCKVKGCMGEPKDLMKAETFNGTICTKCFCVYEYEQKSLKPIKVDKKEKKRLEDIEALENGLETENEKTIAKKMLQEQKPKSKTFVKSKPKLMQQDIFGGQTEMKKTGKSKKEKPTILNLGLKK